MFYPQCISPVDTDLILRQKKTLGKQQKRLELQQKQLLQKQLQLLQQKRMVIESQFQQYHNQRQSNLAITPNLCIMQSSHITQNSIISPNTTNLMTLTLTPGAKTKLAWESPTIQPVGTSPPTTCHGGTCTILTPSSSLPTPELTLTISGSLQPSFPPPQQIDTAKILAQVGEELEESCWFHGSLTWQQSSALLANSKPGTFLIRDSQDPRFLYSLSVRREDGPTSVRIQFSNGEFRLDSDEKIRQLLTAFASVGELVQHYVDSERNTVVKEVLVGDGKVQPPITLRKPLYKIPPSLAHCSRLAINNNLRKNVCKEKCDLDSLELPRKLVDYIKAYPLTI